MKSILMMMLGLGLTIGAIAGQPKIANTGRLGGTPAKVVIVRPYGYYPYRFGYSPLYSPFYYGYNSFYYTPFAYQRRPSKLDLQIDQINNDYHHEIAAVRHDNSLSKTERKQKIRDLRHEKVNSIIETKKGFYNSKERDTDK